ncbi:LLM class flavin-dependent oxidoreductase [Kribbella sandramycini]|uniref:LLM class flavin-dependent oxidoreductase n=1 Tax=Kribbella sandramycini TaxID=60450 RepID=A0A7Y4KVV8_9ACTN|nr:LLM class flavin-dependent oxidoreductase [Kribbella sandramycini]MBB6567751.1 hypothetical protein [Kribbella sandramycini]NOL39653.1 LLM class flavin-dependent oxidoreductase [Kribbella sandramycini]
MNALRDRGNYAHRLEFGVRAAAGDEYDAERSVRQAVLAEELGYDVVALADRPDTTGIDALTALGWIAARTSKIKLRADVLTPRDPALLARTIASLDHLSGGRAALVLGTAAGAGAAGEAVDVIRALWNTSRTGTVRYSGHFYRLSGAQPGSPAHQVPITVLGDDDRAAADLAGRKGDGWTASYPAELSLGDAAVVIDRAAELAGRDAREVRRELLIRGGLGVREGIFTGSPAEWVSDLLPLVVDHGVSGIVLDLTEVDADGKDLLTRFAQEVVPALKAGVDKVLPDGWQGRAVRSRAALARRAPGVDYDDVPADVAEVLEPGDPRYRRYRGGYLRGGTPGIVLRAETDDQVVEALAYARRHPHLPLARRSGGHGISGRSTNAGGIVIDVSGMNTIEVIDEATRRVRIGPGARWMDVAAALLPYGWALSSGDYGGVGVGGLATAGGIGYLSRAHGLTIDHLVGVRMVLADGSIVEANEVENPDLFWAVRGAGANFGIVTSFEFVVDVVGDVGYAELTHDASDTAGFLVDWGSVVEDAPRALTSFLVVSPARRGQPSYAQSRTMVDSGDPETVLAHLQPLADIAPLLAQQAQILPYAAVMANAADQDPRSAGEPVSRSGLLAHITPEFADAAARVLRGDAVYFFQIRSVGGAVSDVDPDATAYSNRAANFSVVAMGRDDASLDEAWAQLSPYFDGQYLSFDSSLRPGRLEDTWSPSTLARLRDLKAKYDPDIVFDDNFAVLPTTTEKDN